MYKGCDLGLCMAITPPVEKDGVWYAPLATMISFAGGEVLREKGKVTCSIYGHTATFFEDSDIATVDGKDFKLDAKVFRGNCSQLYIPVEGFTKAFGMKWAYAKRNNFISIEHPSEDKPICTQP